MKNVLQWVLSIFVIAVLAGCSEDVKNPLNWKVKDFEYESSMEQTVSKADLKGKVVVSDFIFTNCTTVCSPMTANLTRLQKEIAEVGLEDEVVFVSFSVDPKRDTPEALQSFQEKFGLNPNTWYFLTGYTQEHIKKFAAKNFQTLVDQPEGSDQVIHGTSFYLWDKEGIVKKQYNGISNTPYEEIIQDIQTLAKQ